MWFFFSPPNTSSFLCLSFLFHLQNVLWLFFSGQVCQWQTLLVFLNLGMSWFFSFFLVIFAGKRFWVESSFFQHLKHLPLPSGFYEFHGEIYYNSNCLLLSVTCHFSITAFKRFSLSFIFKSLTLICFVVDLFGFLYLGFFFRILNLRVYVFSNFGRFSAIISLTTFQPRLSSHLFRIVDTNFLSLL